ncbi:hypothetical protein ACFL1A_03300 [Patescibacteria group bacterium]
MKKIYTLLSAILFIIIVSQFNGVFALEQDICCDTACTEVKSAIGCIPTDISGQGGMISLLMTFGIGIAGGIALLLILMGGFQIMTSAGNPEQLNAGRELVGSAVTGLLLIVFSVFILRLIGVDILGIPGFG